MLNFSVVGVGSFGVKRAKAIQECKNAKLASVCDKSPENANKAKSILNVDIKSFEEILNDRNIHVICICTPNKFHLPLIKDSLNAGKHVFCEKPLCRNFQEAQGNLQHFKKIQDHISNGFKSQIF